MFFLNKKDQQTINKIFDEDSRIQLCEESLKFAQKILISDDGDIVSTCRVLIPEYSKLFEIAKDEGKKPSEKERFELTESDNGIKIQITRFNLDREFDNREAENILVSKQLTNVLYIVDSLKWWNTTLYDKQIKQDQNFFIHL